MKQSLYSGYKLPFPGAGRTLFSFLNACLKRLPVWSLEDREEEGDVYELLPS